MTDTDQQRPTTTKCHSLRRAANCPVGAVRWIKLGVKDLLQAPQQSLIYGLSVALMIAIVSLLAWMKGSQWIMFAMLGGFVFLAPLTCNWSLRDQRTTRARPTAAHGAQPACSIPAPPRQRDDFAIILLIIFLVWARAAVIITVFFPTDGEQTLAGPAALPGFGSMIGSVFAAVTFLRQRLLAPDDYAPQCGQYYCDCYVGECRAPQQTRDVHLADNYRRQPVARLVTAFVGLIVIIPVIGYAAWHGYLETIEAEEFRVTTSALPRCHGANPTRRSSHPANPAASAL